MHVVYKFYMFVLITFASTVGPIFTTIANPEFFCELPAADVVVCVSKSDECRPSALEYAGYSLVKERSQVK